MAKGNRNLPTTAGMSLANFPALTDFIYQPWTNWQGLFQGWFSPTITFGANIQDKPVEEHVLNAVGSYGKQLNRIIDAISVLVARLNRSELTLEEQYAVLQFEELARLAALAAAEFQGKPLPEGVTRSEVNGLLDRLAGLRRANPAAYESLSKEIRDGLPPVTGEFAHGMPTD